jgi:hypothetical protein
MTTKKSNNSSTLKKIKSNLLSEELIIAETALKDLCKLVDKNCTKEINPLAEYFGKEPSFDSLVYLPELDASFEKFKADLGTDTILSLVKTSLKSVSRDNYNIALLSIREIINRKDANAQKKVFKLFKQACDYYDYGHRSWGETILDILYDSLFKEFECSALINLLSTADLQMFYPEDGDQADHLFIAGFKKCEKNTDLKKLTLSFFKYKRECISLFGADYFKDLQNQIEAVLDDKQKLEFAKEIERKAKEYRIFDLMTSEDKKDVLELIDEIGKKENAKFIDEDGGKVSDKLLNRDDLSKEELLKALDGFIKQKANSYASQISFALIPKFEQEEFFNYLRSKLSKDNGKDLFFVVDGIIDELKEAGASLEQCKPWYALAQTFNPEEDAHLFSEDISAKFKEIIDNTKYDESFYTAIDQLNELVDLIKNPPIEIHYLNLNKGFLNLVERDEAKAWEAIKTISHCFFKVMIEQQIFRGLHIAIIASGKTNDLASLKSFEAYFPKDIEQSRLNFNPPSAFNIVLQRLAYNLASVYAMFSEKEKMIYYINQSIDSGKSKDQFLEDTDFEAYREDKDFIEALGK